MKRVALHSMRAAARCTAQCSAHVRLLAKTEALYTSATLAPNPPTAEPGLRIAPNEKVREIGNRRYQKIAELQKRINDSHAIAYVFVICAASSAPIMEAAFGRLHKGGTPLVDSITGEEAANITQT